MALVVASNQSGPGTFSSLSVLGQGATALVLAGSIAEITGTVAGYMSLDVRNTSSNASASGDVVVTADTGTDTTQYVNMGVNNSGFAVGSWTINGALDGYLYASDGNMAVGTAGAAKALVLFAGSTLAAAEGFRLSAGLAQFTAKLYPPTDAGARQSAAAIYGGTGAPSNANGANGDIYIRSDGGAGTTIYQRRTGTWTGIV